MTRLPSDKAPTGTEDYLLGLYEVPKLQETDVILSVRACLGYCHLDGVAADFLDYLHLLQFLSGDTVANNEVEVRVLVESCSGVKYFLDVRDYDLAPLDTVCSQYEVVMLL